ncbi:MAG: hypothetical protein KF799_15750 [Bdellovibrionales bacterium]|nr:hypothetical protein [Bdellovibrionales bacterium]
MMNVKGGTQTWSTSAQQPSYKSDNTQNLSATDRTKVLGEDSVGDMLNKVADPNYVDTSKKMRTVGDNQLGKDAFMTMLLAQMKNQDPSNPLKSHEMAAQLAQFTQLEKLNNIDESIAGMRKDNQPTHNFQALTFIGKSIMTDTSKVSRMDKDGHHEIRFNLPADAPALTMRVKDAEGTVIRTIEHKNLKAGKNELAWNGLTDDGSTAPIGEYSIEFDAKASNGRGLFVETKTEGIISGVNFTPQGPQLMVGKQVISMSDVKSISDPAATQVPAATQTMGLPVMPGMPAPQPNNMIPIGAQDNVQPKGPKKVEVKPENKPDAEKRAKMEKGNLNDAAMAQGLINKLNKEGAKSGMEG